MGVVDLLIVIATIVGRLGCSNRVLAVAFLYLWPPPLRALHVFSLILQAPGPGTFCEHLLTCGIYQLVLYFFFFSDRDYACL